MTSWAETEKICNFTAWVSNLVHFYTIDHISI